MDFVHANLLTDMKKAKHRFFERKVYQAMLQWKENLAPDCALFLEGASGVGKTTLAEKLGKEAYQSYLVIRFDQVSSEVKALFEESHLDLDRLFNALQVFFKTRLYPRQSLIILDEIQSFPPAR